MPRPTVLLRHAQRSDTHLDWMLDLPSGRGLATFRCRVAWPDWARVGRVTLTRLPDHRRAWLDRQGPASGGRGRVTRLGRGVADLGVVHRHGFHVGLRWPDGPGVAAGAVAGRVVRLHRDRFEFLADPAPPPPHPAPSGRCPG